MGDFGFWKTAQGVEESNIADLLGWKTLGVSGDQIHLVIETFHNVAGELLLASNQSRSLCSFRRSVRAHRWLGGKPVRIA